jgi:hypothetical protein
MAPSLVSAVTGTAFMAASVLATDKVYKLKETYEGSGFFDKFNFYQVRSDFILPRGMQLTKQPKERYLVQAQPLRY